MSLSPTRRSPHHRHHLHYYHRRCHHSTDANTTAFISCLFFSFELGLFKKINERGVRLDSGGSNKGPFWLDFGRQPWGGGCSFGQQPTYGVFGWLCRGRQQHMGCLFGLPRQAATYGVFVWLPRQRQL
uniref:Uncharacterized protein n=1 Tax=Tanacetum cinerariifolium TaxID=118510 RepID=A0A699R7I0_TANCI|nr:hypothetical protein [Tanacetum cinerariifolium]